MPRQDGVVMFGFSGVFVIPTWVLLAVGAALVIGAGVLVWFIMSFTNRDNEP